MSPGDRLARAVEAYQRRFGAGPAVWGLLDWPDRLAAELEAAVAAGQPVTDAELHRRLGGGCLPTIGVI